MSNEGNSFRKKGEVHDDRGEDIVPEDSQQNQDESQAFSIHVPPPTQSGDFGSEPFQSLPRFRGNSSNVWTRYRSQQPASHSQEQFQSPTPQQQQRRRGDNNLNLNEECPKFSIEDLETLLHKLKTQSQPQQLQPQPNPQHPQNAGRQTQHPFQPYFNMDPNLQFEHDGFDTPGNPCDYQGGYPYRQVPYGPPPPQLNYHIAPHNYALPPPQVYGHPPRYSDPSPSYYGPPFQYYHPYQYHNVQPFPVIPPQTEKVEAYTDNSSSKFTQGVPSNKKQLKSKKAPLPEEIESDPVEEGNQEVEVRQQPKGSSTGKNKISAKKKKILKPKKPVTPEVSSESESEDSQSSNGDSSDDDDDDDANMLPKVKRRQNKATNSRQHRRTPAKRLSFIKHFQQLKSLGGYKILNNNSREFGIIKQYLDNSFSHLSSRYHVKLHAIAEFGHNQDSISPFNSPYPQTRQAYSSSQMPAQVSFSAPIQKPLPGKIPPVQQNSFSQQYSTFNPYSNLNQFQQYPPANPYSPKQHPAIDSSPAEVLLWSKTTRRAVSAIASEKDGCAAFYDRCVRALALELQDIRGSFRQILLLSSVSLGKIEKSKRGFRHWKKKGNNGLRRDRDTVKCMGRYTPDWDSTRELDLKGRVIVPCGKTRNNNAYSKSSLYYNEYVVFDGSRANVKYAVDVEISYK